MILEHRNGLLFTSVTINYQGKTREINNIVVDTGVSHSLISQDVVDEIGIRVSLEDDIVVSYGIGGKEHAFVKKIDGITVGDFVLSNFTMDFSTIAYEDINGLLGLDILLRAGFLIDLKNLTMNIAKD